MSEHVTPKKTGKAFSLLTDHDIYLLREGTHGRLYEKLGAHTLEAASGGGVRFAVWAPNAEEVSAVGEFNDWHPGINPLAPREDESGIWEGVVPMAAPGQRYKYHVRSRFNNYRVSKADPFAFCCETPPGTASIIGDLAYPWGDMEWMGTNRYDPLQNKPGTWFTSVMVLARRKRQCRGERPVLWTNEFNLSVSG